MEPGNVPCWPFLVYHTNPSCISVEGRQRLTAVLRGIEELVTANPCNWDEAKYGELADTLQAILGLNQRQEVSRDGAARILGISVRSLNRKVSNGEIKPPHRNGDKSGVKYYTDDLLNAKQD